MHRTTPIAIVTAAALTLAACGGTRPVDERHDRPEYHRTAAGEAPDANHNRSGCDGRSYGRPRHDRRTDDGSGIHSPANRRRRFLA